MNFKKMFIGNMLIILLMCMCLSTVCAQDNVGDVSDNAVIANLDSDNIVIGDAINGDSFTDLNNLIKKNTNGTLDLDRNYKFNKNIDSALRGGIEINKKLTINGNNFVIDGNHESTIFKNSVSINYLIINDLSLINANSSGYGGACNLNKVSNNIVFNNVNFSNNFAKFGAGAIYAPVCTDVTLINSHFNNNSANPSSKGGYGGAILVNKNLKIDNCVFANNFANRDGGVIYSMTGRNLIIRNSSFINNSAKEVGGNIFFSGPVTIVDSVFINNSAEKGGVIYTNNKNPINISNSVFNNNFAAGEKLIGGGCIYAEKSPIYVSNSVFNNNFARGENLIDGGCIYSKDSTINIANTNFTNNSVISDIECYGGCISGKYVNITDTRFVNNSAKSKTNTAYAGVVWCVGLNLNNSTFVNNRGSLSVIDSNVLTMSNSFIDGNVATYRAIIKAITSTVTNSSISNNYGRYGILYTEEGDISDSIFKNNIAGKSAGVTADSVWISNCVFTNNTGNFAGAVLSINSTIFDSNFTNNQGYLAKDIVVLTKFKSIDNSFDESKVYNISAPLKTSLFIPNYCIEEKAGAPPEYLYFIDEFYAYNSINHTDVSELIKLAIYFYDNPQNDLQGLIWALTDHDYRNYTGASSIKTQLDFILDKYDNGFRVGEVNNTKILENGTFKIFNFFIALTPLGQSILTYNYTYVYPTDLVINKVANESCVVNGSLVSWNITVWNNSTFDAFDVIVNDILPEGFILKNNSTSLIWNIGTLLAGSKVSFTLETIAVKVGNWTNAVKVSTSTIETNYTNNVDNDTVQVVKPELVVEKISLNNTVYLGNQTGFTVVVRNTGDCSLDNVYVIENIPEGLVYAGFTGDKWVKKENKFIYTGSLAVGKSANFTIFFNTTKSGNLTNVVVAGADHVSNKTANNTTTVYAPSLEVVKLINTPNVYLGNQTGFTVVVRNTGDCSLDNVYVIENIPEGLVYAGFTGDKWVKKENKFIYTGSLAAGKSANFTIFFNTTKSGNFTNVVVAGADHVSNKTANNTTEVIENSTVPENNTDNSTDNSIVKNQSTDINKSADVKNATGNPILVLLMVLALLGLRPLKGKK